MGEKFFLMALNPQCFHLQTHPCLGCDSQLGYLKPLVFEQDVERIVILVVPRTPQYQLLSSDCGVVSLYLENIGCWTLLILFMFFAPFDTIVLFFLGESAQRVCGSPTCLSLFFLSPV